MIRRSTTPAASVVTQRRARQRDTAREYALTILRNVGWPGNSAAASLRSVGLTSCQSGEGVSTVAAQLALAAASCGDHQVLLADANFACPRVHGRFGIELGPGLADVLLGALTVGEAIRPSAVANLVVLPAGRPDGDSARLYDSVRLAETIEQLTQRFGLVIFDLPAMGQTSATVRLAGLLEGVVLVVEAERVRWEAAQRATELLRRGNAILLGAVLNKRRAHVPDWLARWLALDRPWRCS